MMTKSTIDWMKAPYFNSKGSPFAFCPIWTASLLKSLPAVRIPTTGMMTASTSEETILPKAAPITIPTARSITLPRIANSLNSVVKLTGSPPPAMKVLLLCRLSAADLAARGAGAAVRMAERLRHPTVDRSP